LRVINRWAPWRLQPTITTGAATVRREMAKQKDRPKAVSLSVHRIKMVHRGQSKINRYIISDLASEVRIFTAHHQIAGYCRPPAAAVHPILAIQAILIRLVPESTGDEVQVGFSQSTIVDGHAISSQLIPFRVNDTRLGTNQCLTSVCCLNSFFQSVREITVLTGIPQRRQRAAVRALSGLRFGSQLPAGDTQRGERAAERPRTTSDAYHFPFKCGGCFDDRRALGNEVPQPLVLFFRPCPTWLCHFFDFS
jgi:hypothetical protein